MKTATKKKPASKKASKKKPVSKSAVRLNEDEACVLLTAVEIAARHVDPCECIEDTLSSAVRKLFSIVEG